MPEFKAPEFAEKPRKESPGEARVRYASLIRTIAGFLGVELSEYERDKIARFIVNVMAELTPEQQKALAEIVGKLVSWGLKKYLTKGK